ncbi:GDT1-like protein 1, chloroplastic [Morella rubra]|uniref:GDT1-like protein 1, chloroplastic n=1 Tax=Morella rubra TaxID=262757 RepID=A0A6A1VV54_9ROSI|nr:GDT1-like protein 1, chloroplastic [Morella rubra]
MQSLLSIDHRFGETDLPIDDIAAVFLLLYFGVSTLLDATSSDSPKAKDEQKEVELAVSKFSRNGAGILSTANTTISTFFLVFVAEWGLGDFSDLDAIYDIIKAVFLLLYFGVSTLLDATSSDSPKAKDEQKEVELAVSKFSRNGAGILSTANTTISTFFLVFVAEWGDKSFFSTIGE